MKIKAVIMCELSKCSPRLKGYFTKSKEKIIQAFIKYYESKVMKNIENKLNLNFSYSVYKELNLNKNQK